MRTVPPVRGPSTPPCFWCDHGRRHHGGTPPSRIPAGPLALLHLPIWGGPWRQTPPTLELSPCPVLSRAHQAFCPFKTGTASTAVSPASPGWGCWELQRAGFPGKGGLPVGAQLPQPEPGVCSLAGLAALAGGPGSLRAWGLRLYKGPVVPILSITTAPEPTAPAALRGAERALGGRNSDNGWWHGALDGSVTT